MILAEEDDLGNDFRSLGIFVNTGQEYPASVLGMDRQDAQHGAANLMHYTTAQMDGRARQLTFHKCVVAINSDIVKP